MESTMLSVEEDRVRTCTDSAGAGTVPVVGLDTKDFYRIKATSQLAPSGRTNTLTDRRSRKLCTVDAASP